MIRRGSKEDIVKLGTFLVYEELFSQIKWNSIKTSLTGDVNRLITTAHVHHCILNMNIFRLNSSETFAVDHYRVTSSTTINVLSDDAGGGVSRHGEVNEGLAGAGKI
ncbi:hypothetical protein SLE2022_186370 [Rubroshorea leprosula]